VLDEPIPSLRTDLEVRPRGDGTVDVRDPKLLQILSLDAEDFELARRFDGVKTIRELRLTLAEDQWSVTAKRLRAVANDYRELHLLDLEEVEAMEPAEDARTPYGQLDSVHRPLTVLPQPQAHARWACRSCGRCCHGLTVEVTEEEEARIDRALYSDVLGAAGEAAEWSFLDPEQPARRVLRHQASGACIFLDPQGRCLVHARQGMAAKPDPCQIFPHVVVHVPHGPPRLALRANCDSMHETFEDGPDLGVHQSDVLRVHQTSPALLAPDRVTVFGRRWGFARFDRWLAQTMEVIETEGFGPAALRAIDRDQLERRASRARRRFGRKLLDYVESERASDVPVEAGGWWPQLSRLRRGREALAAMAEGRPPPELGKRPASFLRRQAQAALYGLGPLQLPDAGIGLTGLVLAFEAVLHAVGPRGRLKTANAAFAVFTGPLLESTHQSWPILEAIDPEHVRRLKEEL
jgi:Fe-S-cluster containining protein